ncbi:MAG: NADH-quinone oxidoreductase subunit L [Elusimicrobiota bacterium]
MGELLLALTPGIFVIPVLAFPAILFLGGKLPCRGASIGIVGMGICLAASTALLVMALMQTLHLPYAWNFPWIRFGMFEVPMGVYVDGLSIVMLFVITLVSLLVQVYSLGYMHDEPRFTRYYAFLSLFTASMLGLVIADNLLVIFACWELVGLCSYFLIGFYFEKPEAAQAGKKAFITTKLGDLGFLLGLFVIFSASGTFSVAHLEDMVKAGFIPLGVLTTVAILLFIGAMGKSAQVPLFVWLPDAMEGPTPVSALIHAATMVAAGIFLVARVFFIFEASHTALAVVAGFGAATAILAALMGMVPEDIKRVLAFSTISQLGYMMAGLAVGGPEVGIFHLTTHAMFKALLFLGAGSVIHAVHTNDIWKMGALSAKMPITFATFAIGVFALCGVFPLSGFFSKDEIIHAAFAAGNLPVAVTLSITSGLTAFYMMRVLVLVFLGENRDKHSYAHAHESGATMTVPLVILSVFAVFLGAGMTLGHLFERLVPGRLVHESGSHMTTLTVALMTSAIAFTGMGSAWAVYKSKIVSHEKLYMVLNPVWHALYARLGFDHFWLFLVRLSDKLAVAVAWFDFEVFDQMFIDCFGALTVWWARLSAWIDDNLVDPLVDLQGKFALLAGALARSTVTGLAQNYLLYVVLGVGFILTLRFYP